MWDFGDKAMKRSEHRISFTKTALDALEGKPARYFVYDTKVPGLALQITPAGTKTFYLYRWLDGKPQRIRLGGYPDMSPELARKQASALNGDIAQGINPVAIRQAQGQQCCRPRVFGLREGAGSVFDGEAQPQSVYL